MAEEPSSSVPESFQSQNVLSLKLQKKFVHFSEPWKNLSSRLSLLARSKHSRSPSSSLKKKDDSQKKSLICSIRAIQHKLMISSSGQSEAMSRQFSAPPVNLNLLKALEGASKAMQKNVTKSVEDSRAKVKNWILQSHVKLYNLSSSSSHAFGHLISSLQTLHELKFPWSIELADNMLRRLEALRTSSSIIRQQMPMLASVPSVVPLSTDKNNKFESDANIPEAKHCFDLALTAEQVSKAINGVPVYTVSNSSNEFVLVSDLEGNKSLGIFCFRQEDAEALLAQVRDRDPNLGRGARVVEVMLDKVYRLNAEGIAFRFLPDPLQIKHAIESENLILKIKNRRCCPVFFCKEDLQNALTKAIIQQKRSNPSLRVNTELQVGSFEDVLKRMEGSEEDSGWADIVFIPPGMDARHHLDKAVAKDPESGKTVMASLTNGQTDSIFC